jgi:hypothetical protein
LVLPRGDFLAFLAFRAFFGKTFFATFFAAFCTDLTADFAALVVAAAAPETAPVIRSIVDLAMVTPRYAGIRSRFVWKHPPGAPFGRKVPLKIVGLWIELCK